MDHLPLPRQPILDPIEVPYRCTEEYDGGPMLTYPDRHGWEVLYSPAGITYRLRGGNPPDKELEAFLQNWLYFGVIHEIFGAFCNPAEFVKQNETGAAIVTTECLEQFYGRWIAGLESLAASESSEEIKPRFHIEKILQHAWLAALNTKATLGEGVVDARIWVSIAVLTESLSRSLVETFPGLEQNISWRTSSNPPIGKFIIAEMRKKGWCPFDLKIIDCTSTSMGMLYYVANLPPPRAKLDHTRCKEDSCAGMTIDSSYRTNHATKECNCNEEFSDNDAVIASLKGDKIPLIQSIPENEESALSSPSFRITNGDTEIDFVAISHVWAEGLGNRQSNALPSCSLKWVSQLVNQLPVEQNTKPIPFWLDTICVPLEPEDMRLKAMNHLREPYQTARHILVLDSYLYTQDSTKISPLEIWARVICCSWSRRLWTFQEARLATNLWYQFADKAVRLEEVFLDISKNCVANQVWTSLFGAYRASNVISNLRGIFSEEVVKSFRPTPDVWDIRESLKGRAVSVPSDEALCLFCAMNLDMKLVTNLPPEERMPKFWSEVKKIPVGLIFSTAPEKLTQAGLHWAPSTFMGGLDTQHWYIEQCIEPRVDGFPTSSGLEIQVPGFIFNPALLRLDDSFDMIFADVWLPLQDQEGVWYFFEMSVPWHQERTEYPTGGEQVAMLLVKPVTDLQKHTVDDPFSFVAGIQAVIGVITEQDEVPHFEGYRHGMLNRYSQAFQQYLTAIAACVEDYVAAECRRQDKYEEHIKVSKDEGGHQNGAGELEEQAQAQEIPNQGSPKSSQVRETPENFQLSDERREACQLYAKEFAESDSTTREICLAISRNQDMTPEESFQHFGGQARFQLQMRLRNRMISVPQTQRWCID